MDSATIAAVDRQIEIIDGSDEQKRTINRVSHLRGLPYVVLLGEPGSGKTTVLESEASQQGVEAVKVRALINGDGTRQVALFLDALDEYRSDGQAADKAYSLANAIKAAGAQSWWLSCRAEDWRKEADIQVIRNTTNGGPIVVAQLLPLSDWEAAEILRALGESEPETFLDKAEALGADAFTHNPLSLRLLRAAVEADGDWPKSRFDLFESAVRNLAHESNLIRKFDRHRPAPDIIIETADTANLMLLVSGARALWRSHAIPPDLSGDRRTYVTAHDLGIESYRIARTLDTALFRGEGEAFEPMHRTIAEFTAARALARAVRGEDGRAAFPLSRALALIAAQDGGPPTELRGLFAWFAAHLAKRGDHDGAIRLIEADAPTVLSYGDAAVFDTTCRRAILYNLTKATPYFRSHENGSTSAGGLAGEDLAVDFTAILSAPLDGTQRVFTVLDALTTGASVTSLKPLLRQMALDPARPEWVRWRAADAWLNGHSHPAQGRRELFDALGSEPITMSREEVRLHLVRDPLDPVLTTVDIRSLISAFRESGRSITVGRMMWLKDELEKRPRPDLFDTPIKDWLRENSGSDYQYEIDDLLDEALAAVIRNAESLTAINLVQWVMNASHYELPHLKKESKKAIREWIGVVPERDFALFLAIKDAQPPNHGAWVVVHWFNDMTQLLPSATVVQRMLSVADANVGQAKAMLELAFACVHQLDADIDLYWQVYKRLSQMPEMVAQFESMRAHNLEPWRLKEMESVAEEKENRARDRLNNVAEMTPLIPEIASAKRPGYLQLGAKHYFGWHRNDSGANPPGISAIAVSFNFEIADAILAGWKHILSADFAWPSITEVGKIEAKHNNYYVEYAALAALDLLMEREEYSFLAEVPLRVAISVLRKSDMVRYELRQKRLEDWAIERISRDADEGGSALLEFWIAALDAGSTGIALQYVLDHSDLATPVLQRALPALLRERPGMPAYALRETLIAAAKRIPVATLRDLTREALTNADVKGKSRRLWAYVDFSLDPAKFDHSDAVLPSQRTILAAFDLAIESDNLIEALDVDDDARALRRAMMIFALGRYVAPSADYPGVRHRRRHSREEVVRGSINLLGTMTGAAVSGLFSRLMADSGLGAWRKELMHARFQHIRLTRDQVFVHPSPADVRQALAGKAPVNAADLRAIACEELRRMQRELCTGVDSPWRQYWDDVGKRERTPSPKIENACRDHLILRLRDRMQTYGIAATWPEVQHAEMTRSDIALLSHAGRTFPIEIKRDSNAELWTAAATQLQHYANADTADGSGLYLVFWFDHPDSRVATRPNGRAKPVCAKELEAMLVEELPEDLRHRFDIIVFDVSDPDARLKPKIAKKKAAKKKAAKKKVATKKITKRVPAKGK